MKQIDSVSTIQHPPQQYFRWLLVAVALIASSGVGKQALAQSFQDAVIGGAFVCALDVDGQVACTSQPGSERFLPPDDLPLMQQITAGQQHACGITLSGAVACWGGDAFGVLEVPEFSTAVIDISAGFNHTCAVDDGNQVTCWGFNGNGQLNVPETVEGFVNVDASRNSTCGIQTDGNVSCWSTDTLHVTSEPVPGPFVELDNGPTHACGLTDSGDINCWPTSPFQYIALLPGARMLLRGNTRKSGMIRIVPSWRRYDIPPSSTHISDSGYANLIVWNTLS